MCGSMLLFLFRRTGRRDGVDLPPRGSVYRYLSTDETSNSNRHCCIGRLFSPKVLGKCAAHLQCRLESLSSVIVMLVGGDGSTAACLSIYMDIKNAHNTSQTKKEVSSNIPPSIP
jgi:hypothetical protein